jgi:hypothetical protein
MRGARRAADGSLAQTGREPGLAQLGSDVGDQAGGIPSPAIGRSLVRCHRTSLNPAAYPAVTSAFIR